MSCDARGPNRPTPLWAKRIAVSRETNGKNTWHGMWPQHLCGVTMIANAQGAPEESRTVPIGGDPSSPMATQDDKEESFPSALLKSSGNPISNAMVFPDGVVSFR